MRVRNVTTVLGLGAFVLVCLAPDAAQAQRRWGWGRGNAGYYPAGPVFDQSLQPGYYGAPAYYGPGVPYGTGVSYTPQTYEPQPYANQPLPYANQTVPYANQPQQYGYQQLQFPAGAGSFPAPGYQPQQYAYQPYASGGCPPGQPMSAAAMGSGSPPQAMPSSVSGSASGQTATAPTVSAQDDTFEPATLNIQPGATVTWVNRGQHVHTVTFDVGRDSGDLQPGGSFSATFPYAGTYRYHCTHHPDMKGTVVVGREGGTGGTAGTSTSGSTTGTTGGTSSTTSKD